MKTTHRVFLQDAKSLELIPSESVDLVVTSPPYPMISMWDDIFGSQDSRIAEALKDKDGTASYKLMHEILNNIWKEMYRILKHGGFACINIGDATRTIGGEFQLFPNHATATEQLFSIGFTILPEILWRKQTNAPNKFMGSGMLPAGAYVTLEHEYILIVRKGNKRSFQTSSEKRLRQESAVFWEERNVWFSDVWIDIRGVGQRLPKTTSRLRSGSFPFEIAYRLINMYSMKNDLVIDPFAGTGTTMAAAIASRRNSIGVEIDSSFSMAISDRVKRIDQFNQRQIDRLQSHNVFIEKSASDGKKLNYFNSNYQFPVKTSQEQSILIDPIQNVEEIGPGIFDVLYGNERHQELMFDNTVAESIANA